MERLGFVPSPVGRALRGGRTGMVGICFQALGSPIVARKIATLQRILRGAGFRALCELTDGNPELELEVIRNFVAMKVDGIVLVGGITEANAGAVVTMLRAQHAPAVVVDPLQKFALPTVELDREEAMRLALRHLAEFAHRRIGILGIDEAVSYGTNRWRGIRRFVDEYGWDVAAQFVLLTEPEPPALDFDYGERLANQFLNLTPEQRPSALVALNDQVAIGAMSRLQHSGLVVPRDVSVLGFDNLDVSAHVMPLLTTVDQHVDQMMQTAVDLLAEQTENPASVDAPPRVIMPLLVARESTGPAGVAPSQR